MLRRVRRAVRRGPNGDGYVRDSVGMFEVGVGVGFVFFGGGFAKKGFGRTPEPPLGCGPASDRCLFCALIDDDKRVRQ